MQKSRVIFDSKEWGKNLTDYWVGVQTARLIAYAQDVIIQIGNQIKTYPNANHMDRTGNLLNSLCWGVSYRGRLVKGGFYRKSAVLRDKGIAATSESFLHEWYQSKSSIGGGNIPYLFPQDGRKLAKEYMESYGNNGNGNGWRVFFAILVPYWAYWENGFEMKQGGGRTVKLRFMVMTEYYDKVKADLKPARVRFRHKSPKSPSAATLKKWEKRADRL